MEPLKDKVLIMFGCPNLVLHNRLRIPFRENPIYVSLKSKSKIECIITCVMDIMPLSIFFLQ